MSSLPNPLITSSVERLGGTLDHFLEEFPSVSREHAVAVLELAKHALISPAA
jgi:hypothetical protein